MAKKSRKTKESVKKSRKTKESVKKSRKTKEIVKKGNKTKDILPKDVVEEVISDLTDNKDDKRRYKFALYWLLGLSIRQSALKAGYSKAYANGGIHSRMREGGFIRKEVEAILSKMPERYRQICQARLLTVSEIEGAVLREYQENPDKAMKHPQILKQIKQSSGVLDGDAPQINTQINFPLLRGYLRSVIEADVIDAETEDDGHK